MALGGILVMVVAAVLIIIPRMMALTLRQESAALMATMAVMEVESDSTLRLESLVKHPEDFILQAETATLVPLAEIILVTAVLAVAPSTMPLGMYTSVAVPVAPELL